MAITLTEKVVCDLGNRQLKIFSISGDDVCGTVVISVGAVGMNFIDCAMFVPLSFACIGSSTAGPIMVAFESSAGGTDVSLSTALTVDLGILKVWGS